MSDHKEILKKRKEDLEANLIGLKDSSKPIDLYGPIGRLSRMDAIQQQQIALNAKKQIELSLQLIAQAQNRLDNNEYGICVACEEGIDQKRLLARPESAFCTQCQK